MSTEPLQAHHGVEAGRQAQQRLAVRGLDVRVGDGETGLGEGARDFGESVAVGVGGHADESPVGQPQQRGVAAQGVVRDPRDGGAAGRRRGCRGIQVGRSHAI